MLLRNMIGVALVSHPNIFDPVVQAQFREHLRRQMETLRNSPWVLGWSLGNEFDEIITRRRWDSPAFLPPSLGGCPEGEPQSCQRGDSNHGEQQRGVRACQKC